MFLIILGVLVFSIFFSKYLAFSLDSFDTATKGQTEGFVAFNSTNPSGMAQTLTHYSKNPINCVYDNLFFDPTSGNIVEVSGSVEPEITDATGNVRLSGNVGDVGGNTITALYINSRMIPNQPIQISYPDGDFSNFSTSVAGLEAYDAFTYQTHLNAGSADQYALIYIPWNQDTYIHVVGINGTYANQNIVSQYYNGSSGLNSNIVSYIPNGLGLPPSATTASVSGNPIANPIPTSIISNPRIATSDDIKGSALVSADTIYYINKNVLYDTTTGVIAINNKYYNVTNGALIDRSSLPTAFPTNQNTNLKSWMVTDGACVLVMSIGYNTVIAVLTDKYKIATLARFNQKGSILQQLETNTNQNIPPPSAAKETGAPSSPKSGNYDKNTGYDYSSLMKSCGSDISQWSTTCLQNFFMMSQDYNTPSSKSDYILKTQIVPPVCPTCPNCPGSGVCTTCGGQGGSGTSGNTGSKGLTVSTTTTAPNTIGGAVSSVTQGAENIVSTGANAVGGLATNVVNSATGLVSGAGSGVKDLLSGAGSGVKDLVSSAGTGVKELVSGTNQFVRDAATGAINTTGKAWNELTETDKQGGSAGNGVDRSGYNNANSDSKKYSPGAGATEPVSYKNVGIDTYSYYGALPSKGSSNFMPVTADFSTFRK